MTIPLPCDVQVGAGVVGVYEYGDGSGAPVFVFHGTPACGAGFAWADEPARERALRLLAPDRPGVGRSTRRDYTVADYPPMVAALADALGIERFAVWGYSGGGPYAAACAALLPDRAIKAVVSCRHGPGRRLGEAGRLRVDRSPDARPRAEASRGRPPDPGHHRTARARRTEDRDEELRQAAGRPGPRGDVDTRPAGRRHGAVHAGVHARCPRRRRRLRRARPAVGGRGRLGPRADDRVPRRRRLDGAAAPR